MKSLKNNITIIIFCIISIAKYYSQSVIYTPPAATNFDYRAYKTAVFPLLSDTGEASSKNAFLKAERNGFRSILQHGDVASLYRSNTMPISCGPNAVTDKNWREIGPNQHVSNPHTQSGSGPVSFITFDPDDNNTMLTGGWSSGLFYSEDYGENWKNGGTDKLNPPSAAYAVVSKSTPSHPNKAWFLASGHGHAHGGGGEGIMPEGIFRSNDKGVNWTNIADFHDLQSIHWLGTDVPIWNFQITKIQTDYNNPEVLLASTQNGIYRTANAFDPNPTWTKVYPSASLPTTGHEYLCCDITYQPVLGDPNNVNSNFIFACVTDNNYGASIKTSYVIYSSDGGITWQDLPGLPSTLTIGTKVNIEMSASNPNLLYIISWNGSPDVYRYSFTSASTISIFSISSPKAIEDRIGWDYAFAISNSDENETVYGEVYQPYIYNFSTNSLLYLNNSVIHNDYQQFVYSPTGNEIWAATHGGVYKYDIISDIWIPKSKGLGSGMCSRIDNADDFAGNMGASLDHDGTAITNYPYTKFSNNNPFYHFEYGDGIDILYSKSNGSVFGGSQHYGFSNSINYSTLSPAPTAPIYGAFNYDMETNSFAPNHYYFSGDGGKCNRYVIGSSLGWETISDFVLTGVLSSGEIPDQIYRMEMVKTKGAVSCITNLGSSVILSNQLFSASSTLINSWWKATVPLASYTDFEGNIQTDGLFISDITHKTEDEFYFSSDIVWKVDETFTGNFKNKVFKITVNNWATHSFTYEDLTYNLPNLRVEAIEYYSNGSEDYIYIGTNRGVYYTTQTILSTATSGTQVWSCYGVGLPNIKNVTNFVINKCAGVLRVGTNGRGIWEIDLPPQTLTSNLTINSTVNYNGDLIVPTGKILTVNASGVLQMGSANSIIVQKGAKVIVNGGTITSQCNEVWNGIQLQGDVTKKQTIVSGFDPEHGYCIVKNNGTIKNAASGIINYIPANENGEIDWSKQGGGIIQCSNANFINCVAGARFISYTNTNALGAPINDRSSFSNCNFITDATTAPTAFNPIAGVTMWNTKGINFKYCTFKNNTPSSYGVGYRGNGITSWDATFDAYAPCASISAFTGECGTYYAGNVFENLTYGIDAGASLSSISVKINNNTFTNNHNGVILRGIDFAQVMRNNFTIGDVAVFTGAGTSISSSPPSGIYLDGCDAYAVQGNNFTNAAGTPNTLDFGIVTNYTGTNPNELKKNQFNNIAVGIQAQENNDGLQLKCNQFATSTINTADVKVMGKYFLGSIDPNQGLCPSSAGGSATTLPGNEFSHTCSVAKDLEGDLMSGVVTYNTRTSPISEVPQAGCYNSTFFNVNFCGFLISGSPCTSLTGGGSTGSGFLPSSLRQTLKDAKQDVKAIEQILANGNSPILYSTLATGTDLQIKNKLLSKSPYLSDSVLLLFLNHSPQLSDATLQAVLVANSPLSQVVFNAYSNLTVGSLAYDAIKSAQTGQSQRKYTEKSLTYYKKQRSIAYNNLLSFIINDRDNEAKFDSIVKNLDYDIRPDARNLYISALVEQGNFTQAQLELDSLQLLGKEYNFIKYMKAVIELRQSINQLSFLNTTSVNQQNIDSISHLKNAYGTKAQNIYSALLNKRPKEQIYLGATLTGRLAQQQLVAEVLEATESLVKVYPNPASNELYFVFSTNLAQNAVVNLYNINGQLVKTKTFAIDDEPKLLELNELNDGIYFYQIVSDNKLIKSSKVVILK